MNSDQIEQVMSSLLSCHPSVDERRYTGVYSIDRLHDAGLIDVKGRRSLRVCIANTDVSTGPGRHWIVVGLDTRDADEPYALVYDSLAQGYGRRRHRELTDFLNTLDVDLIYGNEDAFQDEASDSCALHVIYFVWQMIVAGREFYDVVALFVPRNKLLNDCLLLQVFENALACVRENAGGDESGDDGGGGKSEQSVSSPSATAIDLASILPSTSSLCATVGGGGKES
ncbi:MAG TPA: hypothetical protein VMZ26_09285 [Pyrinomonadaceae bacterium]|nr:hypothetical protein [Pyrinomonadaceae bacterium]